MVVPAVGEVVSLPDVVNVPFLLDVGDDVTDLLPSLTLGVSTEDALRLELPAPLFVPLSLPLRPVPESIPEEEEEGLQSLGDGEDEELPPARVFVEVEERVDGGEREGEPTEVIEILEEMLIEGEAV